MYKYIVMLKDSDISEFVFAVDSDEAKVKFCKRRGLTMDVTKLSVRRAK